MTSVGGIGDMYSFLVRKTFYCETIDVQLFHETKLVWLNTCEHLLAKHSQEDGLRL